MRPLFARERNNNILECVNVYEILAILDKESSVFMKVFGMKHSQILHAMFISKTPRIELLA